MDRDRERGRDPAFPVRIPALASPSSKTSHMHPHVISSEKSNYFTTLSNSVVNEPPRLYPSKDLSSYYEKVSVGGPCIVATVGAVVQSQGTQSLSSYSSKASLSKPPPLIKHQPEGGEGLAGKITEQLNQQGTLVQPQHHSRTDKIACRSPVISSSSSTSSSLSSLSNHHHHHHLQQQNQQQHQLRAMPSLHRAPVFHPPTQHSLERKEAAEQEKERERERTGYGGRLSPPTLTPIQPVSLAAAGTKTSVEQQKPPTLVPELRDIKSRGITATVTSVASTIGGDIMTDGWRGREMIQEKGSVYSREKEVSWGKPQVAMASVIVRSATSKKSDSSVGANRSGPIIHKEFPTGRLYPSNLEGECPKFSKSVREPGAGRVIQPNLNLDGICVKYKNTSMHGIQGLIGASSTDPLCRSALLVSSADETQKKTLKSGYSAQDEFSASKTAIGDCVLSHSGPEREKENHEGFDSHIIIPGLSLPPPSSAGTPFPVLSLTSALSSISGSRRARRPAFIHLKKHKAALAAAQSRSNLHTATSMTTGNSSQSLDSVDKTPNHSSTPPPCSSQASLSSVDSSSSCSAIGSTTSGKSSPLPNGQSLGSALVSCGQPSNYHKLKKAWLTRHSEEDRNTTATTSSTSTKAEKLLTTTTTSTCKTAAMSDMIKPCTVNLSASTSTEVEMNKDNGSKCEKERQMEEKTAGGGGGEERKLAPLSRRGNKRSYDSGSESGGGESDASESKMEGRAKRQPKPTYKKKQNDMAKRKGDNEKEEDDVKPNGIFRSAREKTKLKLASSSKCTLLMFTTALSVIHIPW